MKRWTLVVLLLLACGAAGTAVYFYRDNLELRRQLAALQRPAATSEAAPSSAELPAVPAAVDVAAADASPSPANSGGEGENPGNGNRGGGFRRGGARGAENFARILNDPEMRAATMSQLKRQIDRTYGDLFVKLGLDEVQVEALRTLLAERQLAQLEAGMLQRTAETDAARDEARAWRDSKYATLEGEINGILGPDGMKVLDDYQRTSQQRQAVEDIARRASYAGAPLSADASDKLVAVLAQAQQEVPAQNPLFRGWGDGGGRGPQPAAAQDDPTSVQGTNGRSQRQAQALTQESVAQYLTALDAQNQAVLQQAQAFLSASQLEALADRQVEQYEQTQQQLDLALKNPDLLPLAGVGGGFGGGGRGGFGGGGGRGGRGQP